jgi:hypothetical protein
MCYSSRAHTAACTISVRQEVTKAVNVKPVESRSQSLDLAVDCTRKYSEGLSSVVFEHKIKRVLVVGASSCDCVNVNSPVIPSLPEILHAAFAMLELQRRTTREVAR